MFVLFVTMCREAFDDFIRFLRDKEVNSQMYKKLTKKGKMRNESNEEVDPFAYHNLCVSQVFYKYPAHVYKCRTL